MSHNKICTKCNAKKPITEFFTQKQGRYLQSWCKSCKYEQSNRIRRGRTGPERTEVGAYRRGEDHHNAKLTYDEVGFIKSRIGSYTCAEIASMFGVHRTTISAIKTGRSWY